MKNKIKNIVVALVLCLTFVVAGCGLKPAGQLDTKANINLGNIENYFVATVEDKVFLTSYIDTDATVSDVQTYRLTLTMSSINQEINEETYILMNGIVQTTENSFNLGLKVETVESNNKASSTIYIQDNVVAMEYEGLLAEQAIQAGLQTKFKTTLPQGVAKETIEGVDMFSAFGLDFVAESLKEIDFEAQGLIVKVNTENNLKRYEISQSGESFGIPTETKMYLIFEDDKLIQCKYNFNFFGIDVITEIEKANEEISFPRLNRFTELSYEDFLANTQLG